MVSISEHNKDFSDNKEYSDEEHNQEDETEEEFETVYFEELQTLARLMEDVEPPSYLNLEYGRPFIVNPTTGYPYHTCYNLNYRFDYETVAFHPLTSEEDYYDDQYDKSFIKLARELDNELFDEMVVPFLNDCEAERKRIWYLSRDNEKEENKCEEKINDKIEEEDK